MKLREREKESWREAEDEEKIGDKWKKKLWNREREREWKESVNIEFWKGGNDVSIFGTNNLTDSFHCTLHNCWDFDLHRVPCPCNHESNFTELS